MRCGDVLPLLAKRLQAADLLSTKVIPHRNFALQFLPTRVMNRHAMPWQNRAITSFTASPEHPGESDFNVELECIRRDHDFDR